MRILRVTRTPVSQPGIVPGRSPWYRVLCDVPLHDGTGVATDDGVVLDRALTQSWHPTSIDHEFHMGMAPADELWVSYHRRPDEESSAPTAELLNELIAAPHPYARIQRSSEWPGLLLVNRDLEINLFTMLRVARTDGVENAARVNTRMDNNSPSFVFPFADLYQPRRLAAVVVAPDASMDEVEEEVYRILCL